MTRPILSKCHNDTYWQGTYRDMYGKRRYISGIGRVDELTEKQAQRILDSRKLNIPPEACTVEEWAYKYDDIQCHLADGSRNLLAQTGARLIEMFGTVRVDRVTPFMAQKFKDSLTDMAPTTAYAHLKRASAMFAAAVRYKVANDNPFDAIKARYPKQHRDRDWRYITAEETERIIEQCPNHGWVNLFALCRYAGLRSGSRGGEALGLLWADVDLEAKTATVTDQKRHTIRIVPLTPHLVYILKSDPHDNTEDPRVCPINPVSADQKAREIIAAAGIEPYAKPFHSLRKSLSTDWLTRYPPPLVVKWLGHSNNVAMDDYFRSDREIDLSLVTEDQRRLK